MKKTLTENEEPEIWEFIPEEELKSIDYQKPLSSVQDLIDWLEEKQYVSSDNLDHVSYTKTYNPKLYMIDACKIIIFKVPTVQSRETSVDVVVQFLLNDEAKYNYARTVRKDPLASDFDCAKIITNIISFTNTFKREAKTS